MELGGNKRNKEGDEREDAATGPVQNDGNGAVPDADRDAQVRELTEQLQRLQAEFENYIKRAEREMSDRDKFAKKDLIKHMLAIVDNLDRALHSKNGEELHKGIELVYQDLQKILKTEGVHPIEALGKPFNPAYHEVLLTVKDNRKTDDTIVEEYEKGYTLHGKVLRYTKVKISKREE